MRPKAEAKFEKAWSSVEHKLKEAGISEKAISGAKKRAIKWLEGLVEIWDEYRKPELAERWQTVNVPFAIEHSIAWLMNMYKWTRPEIYERIKRKLEEVVA